MKLLSTRFHQPVDVEAGRTDSATFVTRGAGAEEVIEVLRNKPEISRFLQGDGSGR